VDYRLEVGMCFRKVVCPVLRDITKGYSLFTGYETHWEGAPDPSGRIFHRVKIQRKNGLLCGCVEIYISNEETHNDNISEGGLTGDFTLHMLIPFKSWDIMELKMLELVDDLFVQSQQRQSIVQLRKRMICTNPIQGSSPEKN
jgi:hypothetical protein